jgi:hypothetical protein
MVRTMVLEDGSEAVLSDFTLGAPMSTDSALAQAQNNLRTVQAADYCCIHSRNQAVGNARKQVKRWETWIADQQVLTSPPVESGAAPD